MKKLFGMIAIVLLFSSVVFGETVRIDNDTLGRLFRYNVSTVCVDGYKFVIVGTGENGATSIVQFYTNENGKTVAAKC